MVAKGPVGLVCWDPPSPLPWHGAGRLKLLLGALPSQSVLMGHLPRAVRWAAPDSGAPQGARLLGSPAAGWLGYGVCQCARCRPCAEEHLLGVADTQCAEPWGLLEIDSVSP